MPKLKGKVYEIIERLRKEGKVSNGKLSYNLENTKKLERIIRDQKRKQGASLLAVRKVIIN